MSPCTPDCRFTEEEAASIHELAAILKSGGNDDIRYLISLARGLKTTNRVAWGAAVAILVGGIAKALYEGAKLLLGRN